MADSFKNLNTEAGLAALNDFLQSRSYVEGYTPTKSDAFYFRQINSVDESQFPHVARWYAHIASFGIRAFASFPGEEPTEVPDEEEEGSSSSEMDIYLGDMDSASEGGGAGGDESEESSSSMDIFLGDIDDETPAAPADADDDEESSSSMDIFLGDIDDETPPPKEVKEEPHPEEPFINLGKRIVLDIFPPDDSVDIDKVASDCRAFGFAGVKWGSKTEKVDLAFGLQKLRLEAVIFEEKTSSATLEQKIEDLGPDLVQRVDVVSLVPIDPPKPKKSKKPDLEPIKEETPPAEESESDSSSMDIFLGDMDEEPPKPKQPEMVSVHVDLDDDKPPAFGHFKIIICISPQSSEVDLTEIESSIRALGLADWGRSEREEIGFGIQHLLMEGIMEATVSQNDVEAKILALGGGDQVQGVDFRSMLPIQIHRKVEQPQDGDDDDDSGESSSEMDIYLGDMDSDVEEETKHAPEEEEPKVEVGKSSVVLEIKPNDDETDLVKMEKLIREITLNGAFEWGPKTELVPVAFGLKLLRLEGTILNSASTSELETLISEIDNGEMVQDVDVVSLLGI